MRNCQYTANRHMFFILALSFLSLFSPAGHPGAGESPAEIELLKKVGSRSIQQALSDTGDIDETAKRVGIDRQELEQLCRILSIDLSPYEKQESVPADPVSVEKFRSADYEPGVIIDYNSTFPYILIVEKSTHKIFVIEHRNGKSTIEGVFECKTGKNHGDKKQEGDHKTPEGIFFLVDKYNRARITRLVGKSDAYQYGDMAFVTNFPTDIDKLNKKNGSGIWLHGTDEDFLFTPSYDTRGCVVTTNETIQILSNYIKLRVTPLIIVETLDFLARDDYAAQKKQFRATLEGWRTAWQNKRIDEYIGYYSPLFKNNGRNREAYRNYKENSIFKRVTINHIKLDNIIILKHKGSMTVQFIQDYSASNLSSRRQKTLYFVKGGDSWKIIAEKI